MSSKSEAVDAESLQKPGRDRLNCCLLLSVIVLFAAVAALAVVGVWVVLDLQSKLPPRSLPESHPESHMSKVIGSAPDSAFKMQNFAYLEAISSELKNHTMPLKPVTFRGSRSVGSNFLFNPAHHSLTVRQAGTYFLYVELNVTCVGVCQQGVFRVQVSDRLSCEVHLPQSTRPQQRRCWTVTSLREDTALLSHMSLPHGPLSPWKLELRGSGLGIFLVG